MQEPRHRQARMLVLASRFNFHQTGKAILILEPQELEEEAKKNNNQIIPGTKKKKKRRRRSKQEKKKQ
jgi:hypothetical protein